MKRTILIVFALLALSITFSAEMLDDNGKAGAVGSPGETTCNTNQCHNSFAENSGTGSVTATTTMNNWTYEPLTTYTFTITVKRIGSHLFGFAVEILNSANNNAGTLTITDAVHTTIKSATISGISRKSVTHKLNGGNSTDSAVFTFNWTSPDTTAGIIKMYYAGNCTNANNQPTGDYIYTLNHLITPSSGNKINNLVTADAFSVYPNPATDKINLHYNLPVSESVEVKLYDTRSSSVYILSKSSQTAGPNNEAIDLPSEIKTGSYILSIESPSGRLCRKLVIR